MRWGGQFYDAILVGSIYVENIYKECLEYGIDLDKVIFLFRAGAATERDRNREFMETILGKEKADLVRNSWRVIDTSAIAYYDDPLKYEYRHAGIYANDLDRKSTRMNSSHT